jgi:formylmethanofuran dehydrogenase subunit B
VLLAARYVALVYDGEPDDRAGRSPRRFDALSSLAQTLNEHTRCAAVALRAGGNRSGADAVLTAHTGYPIAVDFARGYPRYDPHTTVDADVALIVGDASLVPASVRASLAVVVGKLGKLGSDSNNIFSSQSIIIPTGVAGIHSEGTALRADDVPVRLRAPLPGPPSAHTVVASLARAIASIRAPNVPAQSRR